MRLSRIFAVFLAVVFLMTAGRLEADERPAFEEKFVPLEQELKVFTGGSAHVTAGPVAKDGTPVQCDLPIALHMRNTGGIDGSGLCVFTSLEHSARWQNIRQLQGFQKWMTKKNGGGWPDKVDAMIAQYCKEQGVKIPPYLQCEANDLDLLKKALKSGRSVGITYSFSPTGRYNGGRISHMVSLMAAGAGKGPDGKGWYTILDNNYPGSLEWMSESQLLATASGGGRLWAVIFLSPPPPPAPKN